jgi:DNA helicase II / ATP-dependent DNA helicase PcrA
MSEQQTRRYFKLPFGSETHHIPFSDIAEKTTSVAIVDQSESDSFYFRRLEETGVHLNRAQIKAVRKIRGPILILAGAGSGKTSVLVCRTGYLIEVGKVPPQNLLLMTFSKKAADEMKTRLISLPGLNQQLAKQVEARTFHSFFLQIIRHNGYQQQILSNEKIKHIFLKKKMKELGIADAYQPESILSLLSLYKMNVKNITDLPENTNAEKELKKLCHFYEAWKKENNWIDFDDVLVVAHQLLRNNLQLLQNLQQRFQYIMVDEFQDTNPLQYELLKLIASPQNHLCVVGDDDQTIYAFQGARNDIILGFHKVFPEAETIILSINYRSTSPIVGLGNAVIQFNKTRKSKVLQSTKKSSQTPMYCRPESTDVEAEWIVEEIQHKVKEGTHHYKDFAILYRTANNARAIFEQLALDEIPFFDFGTNGTYFYDQSTIVPVVAYLRLSMNPLDWYSFEQILPTLYIPKERGMQFVHRAQISIPKNGLMEHLVSYPGLQSFQIREIEKRIKLVEQLISFKPTDAVKRIRHDFYDRYLETNERQIATTHKEFLKEQLDELEASTERFQTLEDFLNFIKDMKKRHDHMQKIQHDSDSNVVKLMTIHKAKGLEFPTVFFIGASEGIIPHVTALEEKRYEDQTIKRIEASSSPQSALEEERRLAYVAITRAKEELFISSPSQYRGKKMNASRFILDVFKTDRSEKKGSIPKKSDSNKVTSAVKQKVLAWICSSDSCIAWQRITTHEESEQKGKECPICRSNMIKGEKLI